LEGMFAQAGIAHWLSILETAGVPCGPINAIDQLMSDPQVQARQMVISVSHPTAGDIKLVASPMKIPTAPVEVRLPPPTLGEHTTQVLQELLGVDECAVEALRASGVV